MRIRFLLSLLILGLFLACNNASAAVSPTVKKPAPPALSTTLPPVQPLEVEIENCNKIFKTDCKKLFFLTLSSINANRFTIDEIQSKTGYIIFSVGQRQFLAIVITINAQNSLLKITPCNNDYNFPIGIVQNMFKYIELNILLPVEKLIIL
jgi:hypothetical protein